jgi:hypothetical protein
MPITRIVRSLMFTDVRLGCRQNCRQKKLEDREQV